MGTSGTPMGGDNWDTMGWDMGTSGTSWEGTVGILKEETWGPQGPRGRGQLGHHRMGDGDLRDPTGGDSWDPKGGDMGTSGTPWEVTTGTP